VRFSTTFFDHPSFLLPDCLPKTFESLQVGESGEDVPALADENVAILYL
jgi:hypothetical protein